jgi:hypothetical protein
MNIKLSARRITTALFAMLLTCGLCARASAATAVSACGTLASPGNYFLTKNLSATGDCLVIGADNVAIDLKGKTITGNGSGSGITDGGIFRAVPIIANGRIRNFDTGISLAAGDTMISNVDSSKNTGDGIFIGSCCNTLNSVTADNNGGTGIDIASDDSSLTKIEANGNGDGGIFISSCCNLLVEGVANNNHGIGVQINSDDNFVVGSTMQGNSDIGLKMIDDNGVIKTTSLKNGGDGMRFTSTVNQVIQSKSNKNVGDGIVFDGRFGVLAGVQANKNGGDGVDMSCRGSTASLTAKQNTGSNLVQTVSDGPCANVNLNAP